MLRLAGILLLAACVAGPVPKSDPPAPDGDRDGLADVDDCAPGDPELPTEDDGSCDGVDSDCDGTFDEDAALFTWYADWDGDGAGDPDDTVEACAAPEGYVITLDDCDGGDGSVYPGAPERCDAVDSDCDGALDDEDNLADAERWYLDADGDGWGLVGDTQLACFVPEGYAGLSGDCDDTNPAVNPAAAEVCDDADTDEDCDGRADDEDWSAGNQPGFADLDADGWGGEPVWWCGDREGVVAEGGDCDDAAATVYPGAEDTCGDGIDADCDGVDPSCG